MNTLALKDLAWTSAHPRKQDAIAYDELDPLMRAFVRLYKENKLMKEMYAPKEDYVMMPVIYFDTNDIDLERMTDGNEV